MGRISPFTFAEFSKQEQNLVRLFNRYVDKAEQALDAGRMKQYIHFENQQKKIENELECLHNAVEGKIFLQ